MVIKSIYNNYYTVHKECKTSVIEIWNCQLTCIRWNLTQANSSQNHYLSDNCLAASAEQVRQVYTTQLHHHAGLREPAQVWEAALPRQCAAVSRLISGCLGHSPAASKTAAGFLHSTSLSRHTSPFRASTPCQPCTARDRKVSRSVKVTTTLLLAGTGSPDLS